MTRTVPFLPVASSRNSRRTTRPWSRLGLVAGLVGLVGVGATGISTAGPDLPVDVPPIGPPVPVEMGPPPEGEPATAPQAGPAVRPQVAGDPLVGTFELDAGSCGGDPAGTWFRMVTVGGDAASGPYVENNDSPCDDKTVTVLQPGRDGGLITGSYQPHPDPPFDGGHGLADRITDPQQFFGTRFAVATNETDPQTGAAVPAPSISVDSAGNLTGDLRSFAAAWNGQHFNQGSPRPDGSTSGNTAPVSGTYDAGTGRFVIEWASQIQGGPFNNFTGVWHLEGTFRPAAGSGETGGPGGSGGSAPGADTTGPGATTSAPATAASQSAAGDTTRVASSSSDRPLARTGSEDQAALLLALAGFGLGWRWYRAGTLGRRS